MKFLQSLARAFGILKHEESPISQRIQITSTRVECEDCGYRTLMTVNGTCSVCGGTSFAVSARILRNRLEQIQELRRRKFPKTMKQNLLGVGIEQNSSCLIEFKDGSNQNKKVKSW